MLLVFFSSDQNWFIYLLFMAKHYHKHYQHKTRPSIFSENHPASRTSTTANMYLQDFEKTFSAAAAAAGASSSMDYSYLNQSTFDAAASALTGTMDGGTFPLALFHDIFSNLLLDATTHLYEWSLPFVGSCVPK